MNRSDLIAKLARFHKDTASQGSRQSWLKFIVTSRPYDDIQRGFQQIPLSLPAIHLQGEQENDKIHAEINRVIHVKVLHLAMELGLRESTTSRLEQTLLAMEHRTYLWLYLAIDDVRTTLQDSFKPDEEAVESVPPSVEAAYEKILARIPRARHQKVKLILQIIVGARRPLAVSEMALALGLATSKQHERFVDAQIDPHQLEKQLRHWCGLFVFVNQRRIYLIHQTARDFLISRNRSYVPGMLENGHWRHCLEQIDMDQAMAAICVRCLNFEDLKSLFGDDILDGSHLAREDGREFIDYCCEWWTTHYRYSENAAEEDTLQKVLRLYNTRGEIFNFWIYRFLEKTRSDDYYTTMTDIRLAAFNGHIKILENFLDATNPDLEGKNSFALGIGSRPRPGRTNVTR
jgi:hypothetical protein